MNFLNIDLQIFSKHATIGEWLGLVYILLLLTLILSALGFFSLGPAVKQPPRETDQ